jgi:hypothetical protein
MADFATVAELEGFLGTSGLGTRGTAMLGYASATIRLYCHQDLEATAGRQEEWAGEWDRYYLEVAQRPITALSAVTIDAVAFTDYWANYISGQIWKTDGTAWDEGPILVTYDSGYAAGSDEMEGLKIICLEVAARALTGPPETFGLETQELRGVAPAVFLTEEEKRHLDRFSMVGVG